MTDAFYALLRSGLWETEAKLAPYGALDFAALFDMAQDQSVVGVIAAGLEHVTDVKVPKAEVFRFIGQTVRIEKVNEGMNLFIGKLMAKLRGAGINALLVKGQGIAQCYERPSWRNCGDVDLFLEEDGYEKAKALLLPLASETETERVTDRHLGMVIDGWVVELHGTLNGGLSAKMDRRLASIMQTAFADGAVRDWENGGTVVHLPRADEDVIYVFSHILGHFYKGGIGLRQICDWTRLLWTYRDSIDARLLESRLRSLGLLTEWKAFAAFSARYLGMPEDAMPLYPAGAKWGRRAARISDFVLEVGNFGQNRDMSYFAKYPFLVRKTISFGQRLGDTLRHALIFPFGSMRFFPRIFFNGLRSAALKEG